MIINMSDANLHRYEQYFQFRDPITRPMQRMRRAVGVNQIMEQRDFERTEFYNDFLRRDGLHFGVNLHVYDGDCPIADWRIWRSRRRENFERRNLEILNMLAPHLRNATLMEQLLTLRRSGPTACLSIAGIRESTGLRNAKRRSLITPCGVNQTATSRFRSRCRCRPSVPTCATSTANSVSGPVAQ